MENSNFNFMKSGFDNLETKPKINNLETSQVLAVMTIFMENAIKISEKIAISQNKNVISDKDIIKSLKCQALDNYEIWDKDETKRDLIEISQNIYHDLVEFENAEDGDSDNMLSEDDLSDDDQNDEDSDNNQINNEVINQIKQKITPEFIEKLNTIETRWNSWNPTEPEYIILKNAIENTEKKFA